MNRIYPKFSKVSLLFILLIIQASFSAVPQTEKEALVDLFKHTNGDQWSVSWDLEAPVASWEGVTLNNGHVVGINLFNNNLSGLLPKSLGALTHLE
ncbi:MAG: hypothetical protein AAGF77_12675, partial [Bacteroidota bacterium]